MLVVERQTALQKYSLLCCLFSFLPHQDYGEISTLPRELLFLLVHFLLHILQSLRFQEWLSQCFEDAKKWNDYKLGVSQTSVKAGENTSVTMSWTLVRPVHGLQASTILLRCHRFLGNRKGLRMSLSLSKLGGRVDHLPSDQSFFSGNWQVNCQPTKPKCTEGVEDTRREVCRRHRPPYAYKGNYFIVENAPLLYF